MNAGTGETRQAFILAGVFRKKSKLKKKREYPV
jgi:hypothetical protein